MGDNGGADGVSNVVVLLHGELDLLLVLVLLRLLILFFLLVRQRLREVVEEALLRYSLCDRSHLKLEIVGGIPLYIVQCAVYVFTHLSLVLAALRLLLLGYLCDAEVL